MKIRFKKDRKLILFTLVILLFVLFFVLVVWGKFKTIKENKYIPTSSPLVFTPTTTPEVKKKVIIDKTERNLFKLPDPNINWKTFSSKGFFEIKYPSDWLIKTSGDYLFIGEKYSQGDCSPGDRCYISVEAAVYKIEGYTDPIAYVQFITQDMYQTKNPYWVNVDGYKYLHYSYGGIQGGDVYVLNRNGKLFGVTLSNGSGEYDKYQSILEEILSSMVWL